MGQGSLTASAVSGVVVVVVVGLVLDLRGRRVFSHSRTMH